MKRSAHLLREHEALEIAVASDVTLGTHLDHVTMADFNRGYSATRASTRPRLFSTPARRNVEFEFRSHLRRWKNRFGCRDLVRGGGSEEPRPLKRRPHKHW